MLKLNSAESASSPSIMEPMEPLTLVKAEISDAMLPDVANVTDLKSIPFISTVYEEPYDQEQRRSFLLMDGNENLLVSTPEMFCKKIECPESEKIKVISIFGNTGDGKSHTMNNTFFYGEEVFRTSSEQNSCTMGVWAAMQPKMGVLCLDTEGLLGTTTNTCRRMRMLLKVLAISDIVIFRTRSERLHSDMFQFLGNASKAFCSHFATALQSLVLPGSAKALGPAVVIFHETRNTKPLESSVEESAEDRLRERFSKIGSEIDAFSSLRYIGIQTEGKPTDYSKFFNAVRIEIENTAVRSPRQPGVVFKAMKALNLKFSGEIPERQINIFPEQYFTCTITCESCGRRCERSMGHVIDGENHYSAQLCQYQHQLNNKVYLCKTCHTNGREVVVSVDALTSNDSSWTGIVKYAWQGSVIECPNCGEIYRSRQYWYGNKSPEDVAVRPEIIHVWKGGNITTKGPMHSAQMVIDGVSYITEAMSSITSQPAKAISDWVADQVNPSYWKPNHEIHHCHACKKNFEKTGLRKHHCRGCGEGFCNACSKHKMPVVSRGWREPVRVCNQCRHELLKRQDFTPVKIVRHSSTTAGPPSEEGDITVRKYSEAVYSTLSSVKTAIDYSKEVIKDTARPSYWVPDADATNCALCKIPFGTADELENAKVHGMIEANRGGALPNGDCLKHHCRACGRVVCEMCSMNRRPVPEYGWTSETRVCDACCIDKAKTD